METYIAFLEFALFIFAEALIAAGIYLYKKKENFTCYAFMGIGGAVVAFMVVFFCLIPKPFPGSGYITWIFIISWWQAIITYGAILCFGIYKVIKYCHIYKKLVTSWDKVEKALLSYRQSPKLESCTLSYNFNGVYWVIVVSIGSEKLTWKMFFNGNNYEEVDKYTKDFDGKEFEAYGIKLKAIDNGRKVVPTWKL